MMIMKKCQIHAVSPITCFTVPIVGTAELNLTHDEIYKCLCAKAEVMEILANGKMINLDFTNYNRDNSIIGEPIEEVKEEQPEPVIEAEDEIVEEVVDEVKVEDTVEVVEEETVFVTGTSVVEDEESEIDAPVAETISNEPAETVKEMKVEARNNNNYKHNNNKKNKKK